MKKLISFAGVALMSLSSQVFAEQRVVCTIAVELGSDQRLIEEGNCDERISSASTFKIAISLMGFDSGIFTSPNQPEWQFQEEYVDWNPKWRQATTPESWLRDSVVWYSQFATQKLGQEQFASYVDSFEYGNRDVSGDEGMSNGLTNAWLSSSLQISPVEQVDFITRMIAGKLPIDQRAVEQTKALLQVEEPISGWTVYGKTGAGLPFGEDGTRLRGQPFGWYVGWAEKEDRTIVFAQLLRFDERPEDRPGPLAQQRILDVLFAAGGALN